MIAVRLQGRLGNQLFQYAFILAAAKKLNTQFYIDEHISLFKLDEYFEIDKPRPYITKLFEISGYKNLFNYHLRLLYYNALRKLNKLSVCNYPPEGSMLNNQTLYIGLFQSENFFKPFQDLIREKFNIKKHFVKQFNTKYTELYANNTIVTVHIRRTDYGNLANLNLGNDDLTLPLNYYHQALAQFKDQAVHYLFITDDRKFVTENFNHISNKTISDDSEIIDLQHLINADACIIANSTFSWWGAWLNPKPHKVIYCPQYFMGFHLQTEIPENIYPENWKQINFTTTQLA